MPLVAAAAAVAKVAGAAIRAKGLVKLLLGGAALELQVGVRRVMACDGRRALSDAKAETGAIPAV